MTFSKLAFRGIRFYWRTNLSVVLGAGIGTAVLVGALVVGDSVQYTLKTLALSRLGKADLALYSQNRYFRAGLADDLETSMKAKTAPMILTRGIAINDEGTVRINNVNVLGIDRRFWNFTSVKPVFDTPSDDEVIINRQMASRMDVAEGDDILIRVEKSSFVPRDAPMAIDFNYSVAIRLTVKSIASDENFGRFSLKASQLPPLNAFVSLKWLQNKLELADRANMVIAGSYSGTSTDADEALKETWKLDDAELELDELPDQGYLQLSTRRIFLDPAIARVAKEASPESVGVLTYFVNELRSDGYSTPYSTVASVENLSAMLGLRDQRPVGDDEIIINSWLADDLKAKIGDAIQMRYFVFGDMRRLEEHVSSFRVRAILPMEGTAIDPHLSPEFPGLSDAENCRDWEPGMPIDLSRIRKKDEEYWDRYRRTPKAFITLKAGQISWGNRFGNITALRYPLRSNSAEAIRSAIKGKLDPASIGLFFMPVRQQALEASTPSTDFGQLFLGLSFFLIISSALLTGLLFVFGIEQRSEETGTLMAMGFLPRLIRRLFLLEGGILAIVGGIFGAAGGVVYTRVVLYALSTVWKGAVGTAELYYHARPVTLVIGIIGGVGVALLSIWLTLSRQTRHSARELLASGGEVGLNFNIQAQKSRAGLIFAIVCIITALTVLIALGRDLKTAGAFFIAGALLLAGGIGFSYCLLSKMVQPTDRLTLKGMGSRNIARRRWRSLATIGLIACGSFLIIAVGANRLDPMKDAQERSSGTGGFALYGESVLPVLHDLDSADGRNTYRLDGDALRGVEFVQLRVRDGDDASCLNLNRVQKPVLLGVKPDEFHKRLAFKSVKSIGSSKDFWLLLKNSNEANTVNAIADQNTITWSLGKSAGDKLTYIDEHGRTFYVKIAGAIANSILQGSLLISEDEFIKHFPSESGYRAFLIDAPWEKVNDVSRELTDALQDVGLELDTTVRRLAEFNAVQNTYLSIFQMLGGLALIIGSLGLGIVVLRNVIERRGELALLRAVGFSSRSLRWLILSEHWLLLILGLSCGIIAGLVSVFPALRSSGAGVPYLSLILTLFAVALSGLAWIWLSARFALRGSLLPALRNE